MENRIAIIGSGMIASSLAVLTSGYGVVTDVCVRSAESEKRFWTAFDRHWAQLEKKGIADREQIEICRSYVRVTTDYADLRDDRVFFEAVLENPGVKHDVYRKIAAACPDVHMIGSCTSALTPEVLTEGLSERENADRIIVAHPFNPVHMVPYFELCGCAQTREGLLDEMADLLRQLGRAPVILKKSTPGFIGNRLQYALFRESVALVEEGVCSFRDIDTALNYSFCPRYTSIGIFEHFDAAGLKLDATNCELLFPLLSDSKEVPEVIRERLAEGKGGQRDLEGFYDWHGVDMEAYAARVNEPYWRFCHYSFPEKRREDA